MLRQREIAESLNVSVMTVSRALRNHPDLSAQTKERVLRRAAEMGYSRNVPKEAPRGRRLGVIFYEAGNSQLFASPVHRRIFKALQQECRKHKVETIVEVISTNEVPLAVKSGTVDALFVFGRYTDENAASLRGIPTLAVSNFIPHDPFPCIVADNLGGMREATEHLISLGHSKILFLEDEDSKTVLYRQRADGYTLAMLAHGLTPKIAHVEEQEKFPIPLDEIRRHTALVCCNDRVAKEMLDRLPRKGIAIPGDCSVVGFDNIDYEHSGGFLTTYAPDWILMGQFAASLLLSRPQDIVGKNLKFIVPGAMEIRSSTAPLK